MRSIKGEEKQYLVLRIVAQQDLVVRVPACNLDLVGVRESHSHPRGDLGSDQAGIAGTRVGFRTDPDGEPGTDADRASRLVGRSSTGTGVLTNPFDDMADEPGRAAR